MTEAASNSVYTVQESADALLNFARQGFTAKEAADMLEPALNLAAATGTDLNEVTAGLGNTLKAFGADSSQAGRYADIFAKAQANANTSTHDLFEAMSVAGSIVKTVGWDLQDLAVITELFGDKSISGSEGATALKTGLANLAAKARDSKGSMKDLGLTMGDANSIFDESTGNTPNDGGEGNESGFKEIQLNVSIDKDDLPDGTQLSGLKILTLAGEVNPGSNGKERTKKFRLSG